LQDAMGARLFKSLLSPIKEDTNKMSFLAIFNKIEKLDIIRDKNLINNL
jgi:hypothetical protein